MCATPHALASDTQSTEHDDNSPVVFGTGVCGYVLELQIAAKCANPSAAVFDRLHSKHANICLVVPAGDTDPFAHDCFFEPNLNSTCATLSAFGFHTSTELIANICGVRCDTAVHDDLLGPQTASMCATPSVFVVDTPNIGDDNN